MLALMAGSVQGVGAMTLEDAAGIAVQTNPEVEAARENRRAQAYELRQGRGLYLPRIDLSASYGPEWTETRRLNDPEELMMRYDTELTLTQLLFDGFAREALIERRAARLDGASLRVEERVETISLDTSEVFLDVMRYEELLRLAENNVAIHREILDQVSRRVNAGQSGVGDLQQAESRLAAAEDTVVQSRQDLQDARARFERIVGTPPDALERPPSLADQLPPTLDEAVVTAVNASPTLRATAAVIDEAKAQRREATAEYYPTVELVVSHTRNHNVDGAPGINNDANAQVRLSWNIFNGGIDEARRMELAHRIGEQRAETMNVERAVAEEARLSWNALDAARQRINILVQQVQSNEQVVQTYRQEFTIGVRDLLDLLDAENELFLSRSALVSAEYVADFAVHRILAVMGVFSTALNVSDPVEAQASARAGAGVDPEYVFGARTLEDVHRSAAQDPEEPRGFMAPNYDGTNASLEDGGAVSMAQTEPVTLVPTADAVATPSVAALPTAAQERMPAPAPTVVAAPAPAPAPAPVEPAAATVEQAPTRLITDAGPDAPRIEDIRWNPLPDPDVPEAPGPLSGTDIIWNDAASAPVQVSGQ
jgi:adhesin transport system outer membrane protein